MAMERNVLNIIKNSKGNISTLLAYNGSTPSKVVSGSPYPLMVELEARPNASSRTHVLLHQSTLDSQDTYAANYAIALFISFVLVVDYWFNNQVPAPTDTFPHRTTGCQIIDHPRHRRH